MRWFSTVFSRYTSGRVPRGSGYMKLTEPNTTGEAEWNTS